MRGERAWFSQWDQIEISWNYMDAVRSQYYEKESPVYRYGQGSDGPDEADRLLFGYGHAWFN